MVNLKKLFKHKEKSVEDLARERLTRELGNSGLIIGIVFCSVALAWTLLMLLMGLIGNDASVMITSGIVFIILVAIIIFLAMNYTKHKNAMEGILEAFLAGERNISNIAIGVGLNNKTTAKMIQTMIFKKIIIDANIDRINNRIVDNKKATGLAENVGKIVVCEGCGAKNTLNGKAEQRCEYCGAIISEDMINENK